MMNTPTNISNNPATELALPQLDVRFKLAALWTSIMFVYAYVDIFALFRADFLEGLLEGELGYAGITVNQTFLALALVYVLPACLMVYGSLALSHKANRRTNMILAGFYIVTVAGSCIGEDNIYYLLGSAVEIVLATVIFKLARNWKLAKPAASNNISLPNPPAMAL